MKTEVLFTATDIDGETVTLFKTDGEAVALAAALANANA